MSHGAPPDELFYSDSIASGQSNPAGAGSNAPDTVAPLRFAKTSPHSATNSPPAQFPSPGMAATSPPSRLPYPDDRRNGSPTDQYSYPSPATLSSKSPASLAARRGNNVKPLPDSPGPEIPDKDAFFSRPLLSPRLDTAAALAVPPNAPEPQSAMTDVAYNYYGRQNPANLAAPQAVSGIARLGSTASISTTRGARGSPPPPETPVDSTGTLGGIEARYAAAGIAGASTLNNLQAQNLAAQQRQAPYASQNLQPSQPLQPGRPWTPTEDSAGPHGPALRFQGNNARPMSLAVANDPVPEPASNSRQESAIEQDMGCMHIAEEPPPAYSTLGAQNGYPNEKGQPQQPQVPIVVAKAQALQGNGAGPSEPTQAHPAFANGAPQAEPRVTSPTGSLESVGQASIASSSAAPPPLPEGWISHQDPASGQYYYIYLPTQHTQWEFPKTPLPLPLNEPPTSPTGTFVNPFASPTTSKFPIMPLNSPGLGQFLPQPLASPGLGGMSTPTAAGFSHPPPVAGHEQFRIAPTNGVYFGPYLRYTNIEIDSGLWFGSIMIISDAANPPTIHLHQTLDLSPNRKLKAYTRTHIARQLKGNQIYQHRRWTFYRYDIDIRMEEHESRWTYAVTSHLGCTRYEFLVASRGDVSWRFIAHSGNDFALNVSQAERTRLGGSEYMWKDVLQKHDEVGGFHVQIGMGNQICADRLWKDVGLLRQWTATRGKDIRRAAPWTAQHEDEVANAYFHYYTSHLDQPLLREAFARIPHILALDDHEIFDGFGSYPEHLQQSAIVKNIGRIAIEMYLLFQQHTTLSILRSVRDDLDLFTITGNGWHYIKYLGPSVVVVGPDCRSERTPTQVMAGPTYQGLFPKVATLPPSVQHAIWLIPIPIVYPRLQTAEQFAQTFATGKKVTTGAFNALGKVAGGVAGIVGAKSVVGEGFASVKKAVGKSGLMSGVLSPFGEIDMMDELRDQWTHDSKDLERTYLIRTLQTIAQSKSLRMSFFSGSTNCCGMGLLHDPSRPGSHKTMYQLISSSIVNAPPSTYVLKMLHPLSAQTAAPVYIPQNGQRSGKHGHGQPSDTKEDMLDVFAASGSTDETRRLMGRRNYAVVVAFDPDKIGEAFANGHKDKAAGGAARVSLAVDLLVQADAGQAQYSGATVKYGPMVVSADRRQADADSGRRLWPVSKGSTRPFCSTTAARAALYDVRYPRRHGGLPLLAPPWGITIGKQRFHSTCSWRCKGRRDGRNEARGLTHLDIGCQTSIRVVWIHLGSPWARQLRAAFSHAMTKGFSASYELGAYKQI